MLHFSFAKRFTFHPASTPYYGSVGDNSSVSPGLVTLTGLVTDDNQNVLDINDNPIKGLYATGNCCGGRCQGNYITPVAGISSGMAVTLGRIAGKTIASLT